MKAQISYIKESKGHVIILGDDLTEAQKNYTLALLVCLITNLMMI